MLTDSPQASQHHLVQSHSSSVPPLLVIPATNTSQSSAEPGTPSTQPENPVCPGQEDRRLHRSQGSKKKLEYLTDFESG